MKSIFISPYRFYLVFFAVSITLLLRWQVSLPQVFRSNDFSEFADGARKNVVTIKARRGDIVDRKGNLLATTRSVVNVGLDPHSVLEEDLNKVGSIAELLKIEPRVIYEAVEKSKGSK